MQLSRLIVRVSSLTRFARAGGKALGVVPGNMMSGNASTTTATTAAAQVATPQGSGDMSTSRQRIPETNGHQRLELHQELPTERMVPSETTLSASVAEMAQQVGYTAPELLPVWLRHGHQVPEDLARDLHAGGVLARVKLCEALDRVALSEACKKEMSGWTDAAAKCLESLLCLQLKLSYLSTMTPRVLKEYTDSTDAEAPSRRAEAALLARLASEHSFPCSDNSIAVMGLLADHLSSELRTQDPKAWEAVEVAFRRAHAWAVRTECLLVEGCDDRITVAYSAGKTTNKYHCSPVPIPGVVSRSSCTSNSSSRRAFSAADAVRHDLLSNWALNPSHKRRTESEGANGGPQNGGYFADRMDDVRQRLLDVLGVDHGTLEAFLTPSGSDAEFLPTMLACIRARRLGHKAEDGPSVTNIVVAAGEVGSGTAGAAGGTHFSKLTPRGVAGHPGYHVLGMSSNDVAVVKIEIRSRSGALRPCEEEVHSAVHKAVSSSPTSVVVVHSVVGSKTGACFPSMNTMTELQQRYGERLLVVVDACQLRSEAETIRKYGAYGFVTIITGSKFYCAIPFCGAVLFPPAALEELNKGYQHLPTGFKDYFTQHEVQHEVDSRYSPLRSRLADWENRGLLLRWAGALTNMEAVKNITKTELDSFIGRWVAGVRDLVHHEWPYLSLLPEQRDPQSCRPFGGLNTIISFIVRVPSKLDVRGPDGNPEEALGVDDLRLFHRLVSEDISSLLPKDVNAADRATARLRILIGQPVKLGRASFGVIRIAFGADMLVDSLCSGSPPTDCNGYEAGENGGPDALSCLLAQDRLAVNKCSLIAHHWHHIKQAATGTLGTAPLVKASPCVEAVSGMIKSMGENDLRVLEELVQGRRGELM
ncbi:unnamed protein product [Ascophyllum nodosum]